MRLGVAVSLLVLSGILAAHGAEDPQSFVQIERGRYLAIAADCAACHTAPGGKPYAGGLPIETPFGVLVAPNITPDSETGIGAWSDEDFAAALQQGRGRGGVLLYPAMPYPYYTRMTREDVLAIRAFLDTLEPVRNEIVVNRLPFPFNLRLAMRGWDRLFFTPGPLVPVAGKSEEWHRGAYLVEGPGHCGLCHTTKNALGGDETGHALQGALLQGWFSPNLTDDRHAGLGNWSVADVADYLKTGHNRVSAATGPMSEVITDSTSQMTDADLQAIALYLKDQQSPPSGPAAPLAADDPAMRAGQAIYVDDCAACHDAKGTGIAQLAPALAGNPEVQSADATNLIRIVLQGTRSVATAAAPTAPAMPALGWKLSDAQAAAVITYIRNGWGNASSPVAAADIRKERRALARETP